MSDAQGSASRNSPPPSSQGAGTPNPDLIDTRTLACQQLVDEAVSGSVPSGSLLARLRATGVSARAATDYVQQVVDRRNLQRVSQGSTHHTPPDRQGDGPSLNPVEDRESLEWAVLRAKVDQLGNLGSQANRGPTAALLSDEIANLLGIENPKGSIPASVLSKAPYLAELSTATAADPHLEQTQDLVAAFSSQVTQDTLVVKAQLAPVSVPLPRTIWRKIILDQFVDFEKLFASMEKGYEHFDDPKDFGAGYALVKKDQAFSKRKLLTEADWTRVFDAWSVGTLFFFRHRESELLAYRSIVMEFFRAAPDPSVAIKYDLEVRDRYARKPFRLDNQDQLHYPLLVQVFRGSSSSTPRSSSKHMAPPSSAGTSKRVDVPCRNWSFGTCKTDPCPNKRKHGICCVCGEGHRAKDKAQCFTVLQSRS
jgi:hypothetical protein